MLPEFGKYVEDFHLAGIFSRLESVREIVKRAFEDFVLEVDHLVHLAESYVLVEVFGNVRADDQLLGAVSELRDLHQIRAFPRCEFECTLR
jgi:hypothetical protein